jgi:hypothetical protein
MEEQRKIVEVCEEKFFRDGFYKTTMDELASELTMSKKTIYNGNCQTFYGKNEEQNSSSP